MNLIRRLLPSGGLSPLSPGSMGLTFCWATILPVLFGFLLFLPFGLLVGMDLAGYTVLYVDVVWVTLDAVLVVLVGSWLIHVYIYAVAVPLAESIERGNTLVYEAFYTGESLSSDPRLLETAKARALASSLCHRIVCFATRPFRAPEKSGVPAHLATGWSPGVHPRVVYH